MPADLASYLQPGYPAHIEGKVAIFGGAGETRVAMPDVQGIWSSAPGDESAAQKLRGAVHVSRANGRSARLQVPVELSVALEPGPLSEWEYTWARAWWTLCRPHHSVLPLEVDRAHAQS